MDDFGWDGERIVGSPLSLCRSGPGRDPTSTTQSLPRPLLTRSAEEGLNNLPKVLPFWGLCISGSRSPSAFVVGFGAAMIVASTMLLPLSRWIKRRILIGGQSICLTLESTS